METTKHLTSDSAITFSNGCQCIVDYDKLQAALNWFGWRRRKKVAIYFSLGYPTLTFRQNRVKRQFAVHRLIGMYDNKRILPRDIHVHHIDENKLNAMSSNLELKTTADHKRHHVKKYNCNSKEAVQLAYEKLLAACRERHLLKKTA